MRLKGQAVGLVVAWVCAACGSSPTAPSSSEILLLRTTPPANSVLVAQACGGIYKVPLRTDFVARYKSELWLASIFVELFNSEGARCAYGFTGFMDPLLPNTDGHFSSSYLLVPPEDVPSHCQYPTTITSLRATLLTGSGAEGDLPHLMEARFPLRLALTGSVTAPLSSNEPCPIP
jgi:hypothetical protein